ncbi:conserved hypothetical protein [Streptomyces clavuligerus]|nr:conserved hypothetical protein [Streptomyces clavuligerus]
MWPMSRAAHPPTAPGGGARSPPTPTSAARASPPVCGRARTSSSPAGSPTPPSSPAPPPPTSAGTRTTPTTSTRWRAPSSRAMSWSAAPRPPAATTPSSPTPPPVPAPAPAPVPASAPASPSRRSVPTAPRSSPSTPAPADASTSARSPPSSCTRPAAPATPVPTSPRGSTPSGWSRTAPTVCGISGVRGEPPPPSLKVGVTRVGGWRNEVVLVLTGLDIEAKAALVKAQMEEALDAGAGRPAEVRWELSRTDRADADTEERASAYLRLVVRDRDPVRAGRAIGSAAVELALGSYPGFHATAPPGDAAPYGVFTAHYVDASAVTHTAVLPDGTRTVLPHPARTRPLAPAPPPPLPPLPPPGPTRRAPLGLVAGARSGDKGGDANIGVWVRSDAAWPWLVHTLTTDRLRALLPETAPLAVDRAVLPNLRAVNFTVYGILGEGVAARARFDPQAKALGEWLRSRWLDIPEALLPDGAPDPDPDPDSDPDPDPDSDPDPGPDSDPDP